MRRHGRISIPWQLGFSLIEVVIVVVIIAILSSIAVAVMSRTATNSRDLQLTQNLSILRNALEHYQAEHGGNFPTSIPNGLIYFTDANGNFTGTPVAGQTYGPYIASMPSCPVGPNATMNGVVIDTTLTRADGKLIVPQDISRDPILAAVRPAGDGLAACTAAGL